MTRFIKQLIIIGTLIFLNTFSYAGGKETLWTYQYGLVTLHERHSVALLNMMYEYAHDLDTQRTDVVAELLLNRFDDDNYSEKLIIWYARVLGASRKNRYAELLEDIGNKTASDYARKELLKSAKELTHKRIEKTEQYKKGTVDLAAIREQYVAAAVNADNSGKVDVLANLDKRAKRHVSVKDIFDELGEPQHLRVGGSYRLVGLDFYYYYKDLGRVVFEFNTRRGIFELQEINHDPLSYQLDTPYYSLTDNPIDEDLAITMLVSKNYAANLNIFIHYVDLGYVPSSQFNDIAAEILSQYLTTGDEVHEPRIYGWISRSLGLHGKGRYQNLLEQAAAKPTLVYLSKAAERSLEEAQPQPGVQPYEPGSVNLDSIIEKYSQD